MYSFEGPSSIDPELLIRMLLVGYCCGARSERRLCEEVHLNLAIPGSAGSASMATCPTTRPSRRTFMAASARAGLLRKLFETVVRRCIAEGPVGGDGYVANIRADVNQRAGRAARRRSTAKSCPLALIYWAMMPTETCSLQRARRRTMCPGAYIGTPTVATVSSRRQFVHIPRQVARTAGHGDSRR